MSWLLGPYRDHRTYAVLAYLLLGLPLGILDFTVVVTGLSVGLGMVVTLIGIPLLVATLLLVRALATLERDIRLPQVVIREALEDRVSMLE